MIKKLFVLFCSVISALFVVGASLALYVKGSDTISFRFAATSIEEPEEFSYIYLSNNIGWERCYLFAWTDGQGNNATYPGEEMTIAGVNQYGETIYKYEISSTFKKMIFSNGSGGVGNQTNDLLVSDYPLPSDDGVLFWISNPSASGVKFDVGYKTFESSDITSYASNLGTNPGPILQAWDWTNSKVSERLTNIYNAGYKAIQISPMQPVGGGSSTTDGWYMAYQPLGFKVADSGESPYGTKTTLTSLTAAAAAKDIDIIVDVVVNHLAAGANHELYSGVRTYEKKIYDEKMIHRFDDYGETNDGSVRSIVRGCLGNLPDLQTETEWVQSRIISMLKEYIDCGVKGFRFDAAKHIETPNDGDYRSNFWPNVIGTINAYSYATKGYFPYCYGEVLGHTNNNGRGWDGYTNYIDVTDYYVLDSIRSAAKNSDEGAMASSGYCTGSSGANAVLYAESHDNYCHNDTLYDDGRLMNLLYGLHVSRANSSAIYYSRPSPDEPDERNIHYDKDKGKNVADPNIVVNYTAYDDYCNSVVSAANKLHNDFVGGGEYLSAYGDCAINARNLNGVYGTYICNPDSLDGTTTVSVDIKISNDSKIPSGYYRNLVNNQLVTVTGGKANDVQLESGVAVLEYESAIEEPLLFTNNKGWNSVYMYGWNSSGNNGWPGLELSLYQTNEFNEGQYAINYGNYDYIIMNNGSGSQTVNIAVSTLNNKDGFYLDTINSEGKWEIGTWVNT